MGKYLIFDHHQNTLSETYVGLFLSIIIVVLGVVFWMVFLNSACLKMLWCLFSSMYLFLVRFKMALAYAPKMASQIPIFEGAFSKT